LSESLPTPAGDCTIVIFGATGDLARRKLLPALVNLARRRALPERFAVLGVGRTPMTDEAYRETIARSLGEFGSGPVDPALWAWLEPRLFYAFEPLDTLASYESLSDRLDALDVTPAGRAGRLFYLATPPDAIADIVLRLGAVGLLIEEPGTWRRVVVEKPFGHDLASALALDRQLAADLTERQIYRIDHYLGKETVQNLMALRFGNGIFEPVWNRRYIDHVQITVAETVGIEDRGGYYDRSGALRDMVQNHLFQLLALTAMEPPISFSAEAVRDERVKVLHAIHPFTDASVRSDVVRGQYGPGASKGTPVPGYRSEAKVPPGSTAETYVALRLSIDNWRFAGVPFYLRTGTTPRARVGDRDPVQPAAAPVVPADRRRGPRTEPAARAHPAQRGRLAAVPGESARRAGPPRHRHDGVQLRRLLRQCSGDRIRNTALRLHDRRPDALPSGRHGGRRLAGRGTHP
jgi:glucose-6-phosphate 1-dehydrogenase